MKKIKQNIIGFIIGTILSSVIGVYAGISLNSNEVNFAPQNNKWNVTKVDEALNDLHSNIKDYPEYNGTTTLTPSSSNITLNTKDKILKSNITINGIPNTYKNLTTTTTVKSSKLLSGVTAYNSDGNLITGTMNNNCVTGTYTKSANSQWNIPIGFTPTKFLISYSFGTALAYVIYNNDYGTNVYQINNTLSGAIVTYYNIGNNITSSYGTNLASYKNAYTINYVACH